MRITKDRIIDAFLLLLFIFCLGVATGFVISFEDSAGRLERAMEGARE